MPKSLKVNSIFKIWTLLLGVSAFAQTPCSGGMSGGYPCLNFDLMARVDFPQMGGTSSTQGNDCWGWTDPLTGKEYAIMGCTSHTAFIDISNPAAPVYKGKVNSRNNISSPWRDVKVYNNHAFIVSEAPGHGMQVFDLTRLRSVTLPQTFAPDALYSGFGNCHNIAINEATGFAYCVGSNTFNGGPHVVNIQDPLNPTLAMGYAAQGYTHDAQIVTYNGPDSEHNGKEIYFGANENKVVVLDVTDKSNPILISTFFYPNTAYTHQGWLTPDMKYWIVGDEIDELDFGFQTRSVIVDMTNLDSPVLKGQYFGATPAIDHNGYTLGNEFYLANYRAGLRLMSTENIASGTMTQIGFFDTFPMSNSAEFNGAWSVYPYFASGNIIVSDIDRGLFVVRKSGTLSNADQVMTSFLISPNPAAETVNISGASAPMELVEIYDLPGKLIKSFKTGARTEATLDLGGISPGIYLIMINQMEVRKLVIR